MTSSELRSSRAYALRALPLLVILVVVAAGVTWGCGGGSGTESGPTAAELDARTILAAEQAGVDLSEPQVVQFYLYFPHEDSAGAVAAVLGMQGYTAGSGRSAGGEEWVCVAAKSMMVTPETIAEERREMEELAKGGRGEFDGWEIKLSE